MGSGTNKSGWEKLEPSLSSAEAFTMSLEDIQKSGSDLISKYKDHVLPDYLSEKEAEEISETIAGFNKHPDEWEPAQPSSDSKIWRYLSLTQLLSILERGDIWFTNATNFGDPYEGSLPQKNIQEEIEELYNTVDSLKKEDAEKIHNLFRTNTSVTNGYVNCWNVNTHESAALWEQYLESSDGVAITSSVDNIREAIDSDREINLGKVEYIDYEQESISKGALPQMYHKRKSFKHEKEFRLCFLNKESEDIGKGKYVEVDTDILIDELYLSPTSDKWFRDLIEETLETHDVDCTLKQSNIYSDPVH